MDAQLHRLLPLLLFAWPFFLRDNGSPDLHPIVLLPGYTCSQIDARLTEEYEPSAGDALRRSEGEGWFRLWKNYTALQDLAEVPCYAEQLRSVYDPVARDYRNVAGVETRVVSFGTTRGFHSNDPADNYQPSYPNPSVAAVLLGPRHLAHDFFDEIPHEKEKDNCMARLVEELKQMGYKEGENLFGAPYDFRYAAAAPPEASLVFSYFLSDLRGLLEHASKKNQNKPVILVTHSNGGTNAIEFLNRSPLQWRRRFIKHFVMVSTGAGGIVAPLRNLASGGGSSPDDVLSFGNTSRSFGSAFSPLPSPKVFGDMPLVITQGKNYSAQDMAEFLTAVGFSDDEVELYRTRTLPVILHFRAPMVPMTCINGVGVPTVEKLVYWDGDFSVPPEVVYGDGDGSVNMVSILALGTVIGDDPDQEYFKSVMIPNATHGGVLSDAFALKRVVSEILEANRAI